MKILSFKTLTFALLSSLMLPAFAQEEEPTGLPGDQFNLEAALEMFKKSESPEAFEKMLNDENSKVCNLDLDENGEVDYVNVNEHAEGNVKVFVLSVMVSEKESQDIARIELEKTGEETAVVQIIGDDEIFGEETIVEPSDGNDEKMESEDTKGNGPSSSSEMDAIVINVWPWPCVRFVYAPGYRLWVSPWRWRVYPTWWRPWRPFGWTVWRPYRYAYRGPHFRVVHTHRCVHAHRIYTPVRHSSVTVKTRYAPAHKNYQVTRKKTTVTGPHGGKVTKKTTKVQGPRGNTTTKSKTTVRGPQGKVQGQKTTVRKSKR